MESIKGGPHPAAPSFLRIGWDGNPQFYLAGSIRSSRAVAHPDLTAPLPPAGQDPVPGAYNLSQRQRTILLAGRNSTNPASSPTPQELLA
jgi:hypothetical protein